MSGGKWYKWAWRLGSLDVEEYDSREEAIKSAWHAFGYGDEAIHSIEGPDGDVMDHDAVLAAFQPLDEQEDRQRAEWPKPTIGIKVRVHDGRDLAWFDSYANEAQAAAVAARLREQFGDRVVVGPIPWR